MSSLGSEYCFFIIHLLGDNSSAYYLFSVLFDAPDPDVLLDRKNWAC